jgi:hypothetical protein
MSHNLCDEIGETAAMAVSLFIRGVKNDVAPLNVLRYCETLEEAEKQFRENFDGLIAAGVVALPDDSL